MNGKNKYYTYNVEKGTLETSDNNVVVSSNKTLNLDKPSNSYVSTKLVDDTFSATLSRVNTFEIIAKDLNRIHTQSVQPLIEANKRFNAALAEPFAKISKNASSMLADYAETIMQVDKTLALVSEQIRLSVDLVPKIPEWQNDIFLELQQTLDKNHVHANLRLPEYFESGIEPNPRTLTVDSFEPIANDEYSLITTISSISSYQPIMYERLETVEMRVQAIDKKQQKTQKTVELVLAKVEESEEMLDELMSYMKKNHSKTFSLKNIRYNAKFSRLSIHNEKTTFRKDSYQDILCALIFSKKDRIIEPWTMEELIRHFAGTDIFSLNPNDRKQIQRRIIDAAHNINAKVAKQTSTGKKFLIATNQQIVVNPNLLN